eukprot:TRINITY_DN2425_c0_g1_i2.p1 TRINITY_DN2425_c0_g1~~TRINITY_DN2425_c0_g1_i2.p1  ORF type:complete len:121 (+),score=17.48 TRINITY_DN2425_c0_g1_i2:137-499(+)
MAQLLCHRVKCWTLLVGVIGLLLSIAGWAYFISFPQSMAGSDVCENLDGDKSALWCSSFSDSASIPYLFDATWGPFAAWYFAIGAIVPGGLALILVALAKQPVPHDYEHLLVDDRLMINV